MNRLYSTMLFVPGADERKLAKLSELAAPAFILDLEDAVADSAKPMARRSVAKAIESQTATAPLFVRVNTTSTSILEQDLSEVVKVGLTGIVLPKVNSAGDVEHVDSLLRSLEQSAGMAEPVVIMPTIETVQGVLNAQQIASASPRVQCLIFGAGDFSLDVGVDWPPPSGQLSATLIDAKVRLVLASRAAGLQPPHDGAYAMFQDRDGLLAEAVQARSLGMFGKHAIHPGQVSTLNSVFAPTREDVERAKGLLSLFEKNESAGIGNISSDGQFIDYPVAARARQVLKLAAEIGATGDPR